MPCPLRPNLVMPALHIWLHQEVIQHLKVVHTALISILIGKRTKITTTTRKSTAWPSHEAFVNQPSRKSWTLKDVIRWNYLWRPCCISRPTTFGFANWLMDVSFIWSLLETSQQLCSWQSSWRSSETRESIWTRSPPARPDKTESFLTRPITPSMRHSKLLISSTGGFLPTQQIQTHSMSLPNSEVSWHSCASSLEKKRVNLRHPRNHGTLSVEPCFNTHPSSPPEEFSKSSTTCTNRLRSILLASRHHHSKSMASSKHATIPCSASLQQMAQRPQFVRTEEKGPHGQHCQNRGMVGKPTGRSPGHHWTSRRDDGHPGQPHGEELRRTQSPPGHDSGHQSYQLTSTSVSTKAQAQVLQSQLHTLHSMILVIYLLTPFTMTHSIHLFQGFRIIQTRMMVLAILHGLRPNLKLKSILEGCADLRHLWGTTLHSHNLFFQDNFASLRASTSVSPTLPICNPSSMWALQCTALSTESTVAPESTSNSRTRDWFKLNWHFAIGRTMTTCISGLQSQSIRTEQTIAALRWLSFRSGNPDSTTPSFVNSSTQRRVSSKKPFSTPMHNLAWPLFGVAPNTNLLRNLFAKSLPSSRFQNRLELWTIIHALGSNTKARFEQAKMLRSNDGGLTLCYALRRLANNIQEPFRTLSLNAIDASIKWWHGKPAPRASALRAPWSLTPNLQQHLRKFLRQWHFQMLEHQVPCHTPSFKMVFIKHAAVLDQLCNHKKAIDDWSTSNPAVCCCQHWSSYKSAALNPSDSHWVLSGSLLHSLLPPELAVIAEGSLSNKMFPSRKEYQNQMRLGVKTWTKKNGLPSMPNSNISDLCHHLWSEHTQQITNHITKSSITQLHKPPLMAPSSIVRTSTPRLSVFIAHAYTTNPLSRLSKILRFSNNFRTNQSLLSLHSLNPFNDNMAKLILGQLALVANSQQDTF